MGALSEYFEKEDKKQAEKESLFKTLDSFVDSYSIEDLLNIVTAVISKRIE